MTDTTRTATAIGTASTAVATIVRQAAGADLSSATPCLDFDLRKLLTHFSGTAGAMLKAGRDKALDADDPWGGKIQLDDDWPHRLAGTVEDLGQAWRSAEAWQGEVENCPMPPEPLGEMALIEVALHGWDIARATGQRLDLDDSTAAEVLRCVAATAEMGREQGAYGPEVEVADDAPDLDKALGLAGRDPAWPA